MKTKIFCDSADLKVIKKLNNNSLVSGFTTNPSLMRLAGAKNYKNYSKKLLRICNKKPISLEVIADEFKEIEKQAYEIQSWGKNKDNKITSIVLRDENESKEQKERFESLNTLLIKINIKPLEVHTEGKTQLGKIINLIYLLDYISLYLAILKEIDPTPTPHIDEVKNRLKKSFE